MAERRPGLKLELTQPGAAADARVARMPALVAPLGEPVSPFLKPGPFSATWSGSLDVPLRGRSRFHFSGTGQMILHLNGKQVLDSAASPDSDWVPLRKGENAFEAVYQGPAEGDAIVRLRWSSADHPVESIPPELWSHDDADPLLVRGTALRRGRALFAERQCLRCHAGGDRVDAATARMPELAKDAPLLLDAGLRLREGWLARWIENPAACREDTSMPRLFTGPDAPRQARDVAAYLVTVRFGAFADASPVPADEATVRAGGVLYAQLGCVGCHHWKTAAPGGEKFPRISLRQVAQKFEPPALREYLQNPMRAYHASRMPSFGLSAEETNALTAFLLSQAEPPAPPGESGDPTRGQKLVEQAGCVLCHPLPVINEFTAPALAEILPMKSGRGCLSEEKGKAPDLGLAEAEVAGLKQFLAEGLPSLSGSSAIEFADRQVESLRCAACHQRDGAMDQWSRFQDEVARWLPEKKADAEGQPEPAQDRPSLTWTGEKLVPGWTRRLLAGELDAPARPWLHARMPIFPAHADELALGLAYGHGIAEQNPQPETADPDLAAIGRGLVTKRLGFGCTDCHGVGDQGAVSVFEAEGVNFRHVRDRLRPEFFHRLLRDPTRIDAKIVMPKYGDAHGYSPITDVLDGEAGRQFESIRQYLLAGDAIEPPPHPEEEKRQVSLSARAGGDASKEREPDWVDDRWGKMDNGPALFHTFKVPRGRATRGIAIRLGEPFAAAMIFDQERLSWRAGWTGEFLRFSDVRWGLLQSPEVAGEVGFSTPDQLGAPWEGNYTDPRKDKMGPLPEAFGRYEGLHLHGQRTVVAYRVGKAAVLDAPGVIRRDGRTLFTRSLQIEPSGQELRLLLLEGKKMGNVSIESIEGAAAGLLSEDGRVTAVVATGDASIQLEEDRRLILRVPAHRERAFAGVAYFSGAADGMKDFVALARTLQPATDLDALLDGGPRRWGEPLVTQGSVSRRDDPLVIDTVTMPYDNPWNAILFAGGHDFLPDGRAAVCTIHGDVWLVDGIDGDLDRITWKRYATGLYQPLGLKVVDGRIYVGCRDQIVIPEDRNGDGEADFYRNFSSLVRVNGAGHSFHTCLQTDAEGNFYFLKCTNGSSDQGGSLMKVSADGKKLEVIATGFRNPNGLGVSPNGLITEADQQGTWVPETRLDLIERGGFYGFMPAHHRTVEPKRYDGPLCWIPRPLDNSAGGQVWVENPNWGPLNHQLLHTSWGRCTVMMVLMEKVEDTWQGGVVPLPGRFLSGVHRGRFSPRDGHLYLTGCDGWQTAAVRDGCFQRLRRTGKPFYLPIGLNVYENGIRVTFTQPLDPATAEDPSAYGVERWNLRWTKNYGSKDWSVKDPNREGRDPVAVTGAELSKDGRSVFLHLEDVRPVMQMRLQYNIDAADGTLVRGELPFTIHKMRPAE